MLAADSMDTNLDTNRLLERVRDGDPEALDQLFARHRERLERMVALRMDPRLRTRFDPSDVVQEALLHAYRKLGDYLESQPLPFYPWLRQFAWEHLVKFQLKHLKAQRRTVEREAMHLPLSNRSATALASRLAAGGLSPSKLAVRKETLERVRAALERLPADDREVLSLRHLEQLSTAEIAAVMGVSEGAVKVRAWRALERLRVLLAEEGSSGTGGGQ